jgi:hypothetical protein
MQGGAGRRAVQAVVRASWLEKPEAAVAGSSRAQGEEGCDREGDATGRAAACSTLRPCPPVSAPALPGRTHARPLPRWHQQLHQVCTRQQHSHSPLSGTGSRRAALRCAAGDARP